MQLQCICTLVLYVYDYGSPGLEKLVILTEFSCKIIELGFMKPIILGLNYFIY